MKDLQFIYGLCKLSRPLEPASGRGVGCWRGEKRRGWRPAPRPASRPPDQRHVTWTKNQAAAATQNFHFTNNCPTDCGRSCRNTTEISVYYVHLHAAFIMLSGWCHEATNVWGDAMCLDSVTVTGFVTLLHCCCSCVVGCWMSGRCCNWYNYAELCTPGLAHSVFSIWIYW